MVNYFWCEDSRSGYQFWKAMLDEMYPGFVAITKLNNSRLAKDAGRITEDGNSYYIMIDTAVDNPDVLREMKRLIKNISGKNNVRIVKIHSFEFALLSFEYLENWVFAEEDELKEKRRSLLAARSSFLKLVINGGDSDELNKFKSEYGFEETGNTEKIAAKLLNGITRNTGFETDKSKTGECFINTCCEWSGRQTDDECGLDDCRLTAGEKIRLIFDRSVLSAAFKEAGL